MAAVERFGPISNPSIGGLHLSFQYLCCYNTTELAAIATAIAAVRWTPIDVTFTRIVCAASEFVALADPVSQGQLFGIVSQFEEAIADAGLPVYQFRAEQFAFHASLFKPPRGNATVGEMLGAAQAAVPAGGLNRDPIRIDSFTGLGRGFHADNGTVNKEVAVRGSVVTALQQNVQAEPRAEPQSEPRSEPRASGGTTTPSGLADFPVFTAGVGGYSTYRIPAVLQTTTPGVVLVFAEGRKLSSSDHGWNDIVYSARY
jgi:hypothetical protein